MTMFTGGIETGTNSVITALNNPSSVEIINSSVETMLTGTRVVVVSRFV